MNNIKQFVEYIYKAEVAADGPPLWVTVTYRADEASYDEWPPTSLSSITDNGIADPGFGSGPVYFSDIEEIVVHSTPKFSIESDSYSIKFDIFRSYTKNLLGVISLPDKIVFR